MKQQDWLPGGLHSFSKCLVAFDPRCNDFVLHQPRVDGTEPPPSDLIFIMGFSLYTLAHLSTHMRCIDSAIRICRRRVAPLRALCLRVWCSSWVSFWLAGCGKWMDPHPSAIPR